MAYPIRFKLVNRATGEQVKGAQCALLFPDGTPAVKREDFYTYIEKVSCKDYDLYMAIGKDDAGNWDYMKVGRCE